MSWANVVLVSGRGTRCGLAFALACGLGAGLTPPQTARADQLTAEENDGETGYSAIEELSYETIFEASDGYAATMRIRVALHNSSLVPRDAVLSLGLPFASQVEGIATYEKGQWVEGNATQLRPDPGRRDPGSVFLRELSPSSSQDIPGAELIAFGIEPDTTMQIEVKVRVYPRLRGDRWELDVPSRGVRDPLLAGDRRVLVKGLAKKEPFWVDDDDNGGKPYILTRPEDMVTVAWPAHIKTTAALDGRYEVIPGPPGFDDGDFRLYLQLGSTQPSKPDHIVLLFDRSLSTPRQLSKRGIGVIDRLFDALPAKTTFDALAFNRHVTPLIHGVKTPKVSSKEARAALRTALGESEVGQGTDIAHALGQAAARARKRGAGRTLVVVVTDGMFPARLTADDVKREFSAHAARGKRRPEVLFVIDDPILERKGIPPTHPVAKVAAELGARISLESLDRLGLDAGAELLGAPQVLGDLEIDLPKGSTLEDEVPTGLVAGTFVVLRGRYIGKPPKSAKVSGYFGPKRIRTTMNAVELTRRPAALVATTTADLADATSEGFARPPWYRNDHESDARRGITQAGRAGRQRRGYLDDRVFKYYLSTRVYPRATACYNKSLTRNTDQEGRVVLEMEVGKGEVMFAHVAEAKLEHDDTDLIKCMTEAAWALDIPAGKMDGQIYRLRYPLRLIAPEEGKVTGTVEKIPDEIMKVLMDHRGPDEK
jgi:hypothetical protein